MTWLPVTTHTWDTWNIRRKTHNDDKGDKKKQNKKKQTNKRRTENEKVNQCEHHPKIGGYVNSEW